MKCNVEMLGSLAASLSAFNTGCLVGMPSSLIPQLELERDPRSVPRP